MAIMSLAPESWAAPPPRADEKMLAHANASCCECALATHGRPHRGERCREWRQVSLLARARRSACGRAQGRFQAEGPHSVARLQVPRGRGRASGGPATARSSGRGGRASALAPPSISGSFSRPGRPDLRMVWPRVKSRFDPVCVMSAKRHDLHPLRSLRGMQGRSGVESASRCIAQRRWCDWGGTMEQPMTWATRRRGVLWGGRAYRR